MPETVERAREHFLYLFYSYTFPTWTFLIVRGIIEMILSVGWAAVFHSTNSTSTEIQGALSSTSTSMPTPSEWALRLLPMLTATATATVTATATTTSFAAYPTESGSGTFANADQPLRIPSESIAPYIWACLASMAVILFGPVSEYLGRALAAGTENADFDKILLLFSVAELHFLGVVLFSKIFGFSLSWIFLIIAILAYPLTHTIMHMQFVALGTPLDRLGYFASVSSMFKKFELPTMGSESLRRCVTLGSLPMGGGNGNRGGGAYHPVDEDELSDRV